MGGSASAAGTLPQIWQRINETHLRHRTTLEIIEEHPLHFPTKNLQLAALAALHKRIALHHPGIPRIIYFRQTAAESLCSALGGDYRIVLYSEYCGDSLERVAEEKGERQYHAPCQCAHLLSAAHYLRDHYGCFKVTPRMFFLGSRKERVSKVWVHSKVEASEPELPSNEAEMCASLCSLLQYMKNHRICWSVTQGQLQAAAQIGQLSELKDYIFEVHKANQFPTGRPEAMRKKANSDTSPVMQGQNLNYSSQRVDRACSIQNDRLFINTIPKPPKIQFSYKAHSSPHQPLILKSQLPQNGDVQLPKQQAPLKPLHYQDNQSNKIDNQQQKSLSRIGINLQSQQTSNINSESVSPDSKKKLENLTIKEIELPLKEMEGKGASSHLPTTSRSPKPLKEPFSHPIEEISELKERRLTSQEGKPRRKDKTVSLHSSGNKFQRYRDAIRKYEEKLRQKFANSTGSNPLTAKHKADLVIRPAPAPVTPQKEYKVAESLYNSSDDEEGQRQTSIANKKDLSDAERFSPLQLEKRDLEQTNQNSNKEEVYNKRLREKLDMEKDLQREKAFIENEMQGLLKQNGRDEYSNIRDKIKQKKETFAQLKAEAAKILEDLDY